MIRIVTTHRLKQKRKIKLQHLLHHSLRSIEKSDIRDQKKNSSNIYFEFVERVERSLPSSGFAGLAKAGGFRQNRDVYSSDTIARAKCVASESTRLLLEGGNGRRGRNVVGDGARGMKRNGVRIRGWVSGVKCTAHRRGTTPRLVRGRRDRCPWDARAFLVREAHETNGRRASPDHAFPREKKLRCVYPWLAFAFRIRPSLSSPRSPIYGGRGWKGVSQFLPYAASNAVNFFLADNPLFLCICTKLRRVNARPLSLKIWIVKRGREREGESLKSSRRSGKRAFKSTFESKWKWLSWHK